VPATVVATPVAESLELFAGLEERRVRLGSLRTVLTVGPPPTTEVRAAIAEAAMRLGAEEVRVQAVWAPESARALWGEPRPSSADPAEATYGFHTYPDLEVLEVRDIDGDRMAGEQEPGELLYTSLGWRGTAAIRLATGSWTGGLVTTVPCPLTGRTVPRLAPAAVDGAWQPRVLDGGRRVRVDLRVAPRVLRSAPEDVVRDWSLRVIDGRLVLGLDLATNDRELAARLGTAVGEAVGAMPEVRIGPNVAAARPRLGSAGLERR
jgi:hypothetical protein